MFFFTWATGKTTLRKTSTGSFMPLRRRHPPPSVWVSASPTEGIIVTRTHTHTHKLDTMVRKPKSSMYSYSIYLGLKGVPIQVF